MPDFGRWTSNGGDPSLNEINRSDRFLDALATEQPVYATDASEAELISLLSGWRDEIRQKPLSVPVTPRDAVIALDSAQRTRRSRRTLALVGSTAAAVLCLGGFASVVAGSGPGDTLYGLRTMIFGEQATPRDDAVMLASQQLAEVQQLVDQGQWDAAQQKLETLTTTVATVSDDVQKQELVSQWQELTVKVEAKDAAATLPPDVPPPTFPEVVVLQTPTSPEATTSSETPPSDATTSPSESTTPSETSTTPSSETPSPTSPSPGTTATSAPGTTAVEAPPPSTLPTTVAPTSVPNTPTPEEEEQLPASSSVATASPTTASPTTAPPSTTQPPTTSTTVALTTKTQPAPSSTVSEAAEEAPTAVQAPPATVEAPSATVQAPSVPRQAPQTQRQAPVTTIVVPEPKPESGSGGDGS
ncbi:hypothetical protein H7J93_08910 [Mycobacterium barrassiae]|uniref:anti-sigma-D factor RsdA n=1 Tax=Mycobacterium barrassiae TaxID=319709 RepID=UPI002265DA74|nr:anti-sigma-D factor RsdA [Mycobacterium barrassiae]MCV7299755.1 hypothetical protein [Mycobacterium barrassiae]